MKTKRFAKVSRQESGDFYYHHLKLPYGGYDASHREDFPFQPDPGIEDVIDISTDQGDQLGFVIVKRDKTVELVDTVTGEHIGITFG